MRELPVALWMSLLCSAGCGLEVSGSGAALDGSLAPLDADIVVGSAVPADGGDAETAREFDARAPLDGSSEPDPVLPEDAGTPDAGKPLCPADPTLVVCYPFDGDALDHGPRANHLTSTAVAYEPEGGVLLNAASGLVRSQRSELAHSQISMALWVRVDTMPATGRAGILDDDGQYGLFVHPAGELRCLISGASAAIAAGALTAGQWQHVACVAEGAMSLLYVDGVMVASAAGATTHALGQTDLHIGENGPTGDDQLIGALDDVRIWEAEWTAAEVAADHSRGR